MCTIIDILRHFQSLKEERPKLLSDKQLEKDQEEKRDRRGPGRHNLMVAVVVLSDCKFVMAKYLSRLSLVGSLIWMLMLEKYMLSF
jgi:hypothetical protein